MQKNEKAAETRAQQAELNAARARAGLRRIAYGVSCVEVVRGAGSDEQRAWGAFVRAPGAQEPVAEFAAATHALARSEAVAWIVAVGGELDPAG